MPHLEANATSVSPASRRQNPLAEAVLRWQPAACLDLFCELQSPVASVLQRAQRLFGASHTASDAAFASASASPQVLRWRLSFEAPSEQDGARPWRVENGSSGAIFRLENEAGALTLIEYASVQACVDRVKDAHLHRNFSAADSVFALHGALLCKEDYGVVVVGPSEAGKSTLSCALWQNGWSLLSDDFCFFQGENRAYPAARRVSLRRGSRALLGEEIWPLIEGAPSSFATEHGWLFHPREIKPLPHAPHAGAGVCVEALVFLGRRGSSAPAAGLQRHNPALAALALLPYCTLMPQRETEADARHLAPGAALDWGAALPRMAPVAARVPVYDLGRGSLGGMVAAVETLRAL